MVYHLLTGATGLLGSYVLRDSLRAGRRIAVLVRPSKLEAARQRVETILARWERETGEGLPRPVVFEGDISQMNLGLDAASLRWIARHCKSVIHNAASLTFQGSDHQGEPWLSNVEGTRRILDVCRLIGIRRFHYVSTAYVCGLREGRILEGELEVGQALGNDYERSKVQAEKMICGARFLDPPTIYRPSIIVGDSRTGYTTTFHGFYAPLKLAHTLVSKVVLGATGRGPLMAVLGLDGRERKNFVPVDWVAAVINHILSRPEHHGKTYHLTSRNPTPVSQITRVMQQAVETYSTPASHSDGWKCDGAWFEQTFREQMDIYRSYWRDDPQFDDNNTAAAASHLPCPVVDDAMLMRMAKFAIQTNFGKPRPRPVKPDFDVHRHLQRFLQAGETFALTSPGMVWLGLQVNGPGGGQWKLMLQEGRLVAVEDGLGAQCTATFHLSSRTFQRLVTSQLTVVQAVNSGRVVIEGNGLEPHHLETALEAATTGGGTCSLVPRPT